MTSAEYFDELYAVDADPWGLSTSEYEHRKRALLLAALPRARYRRAFEPGCAIGVTTAALADRCDELVAMDGSAGAVEQARARTAGRDVVVRHGRILADWPSGSFDLVVLSELLYYLDEAARRDVAHHLETSLTPSGDVVAVHWRHPFSAAPTTGELVHAELRERLPAAGFVLMLHHREPDFLMEAYRLR
ncbi:MAG: class I SAM-dependent methyltransferase [Nocardioidaceae bacterium]